MNTGTTTQSQSPSPKPGRPRKLDDLKRHEICALVAGGCSLREAARYVGCGINTIRRELQRNTAFSAGVRQSEIHAQLSPLRAMQQAATKHWRAAAWMLERAYPERFARRDSSTLPARQVRQLLNEVINIIRIELRDPRDQAAFIRRLKPVFDESIRAASDSRRTSGELRQALEFFDRRQQPRHHALAGSADAGMDAFLESCGSQLPAGAPGETPPETTQSLLAVPDNATAASAPMPRDQPEI